jgi:hypothetical protein
MIRSRVVGDSRTVSRVAWMRSGQPTGTMMATYMQFCPATTYESHSIFSDTMAMMGLEHVVRVPMGRDSVVGTCQRVIDLEVVHGHWSLYYEGGSDDSPECIVVGFENVDDAVLCNLALR